MTYFVTYQITPNFIIQLYSLNCIVSRILAYIYVKSKYTSKYLCNFYTKTAFLAIYGDISHKIIIKFVKKLYRKCKAVKKYKLLLFSNDLTFAENAENFLCRGKDEVKKGEISFSCEFLSYFASAKDTAGFFAGQDGENLYVCPIVRGENFYDDILCALKILPFCKNAFVFLSGNGKNLCKNAPEILSRTIFTSVLHTDFKHRGRKIKSRIFSLLEEENKSGFQNFYMNEILGFSKGTGRALYEKNPCLMPLAPYLIASDKANIEILSNAVGIDLLDNIKILKELCVALELLKSGGSEKKYVLSEVDAKTEAFARKISETVLE